MKTNLLLVLRHTCFSLYWFNNNHIYIAIQQYIANILHAICTVPICHIVTALIPTGVYRNRWRTNLQSICLRTEC